MKGTFPCDRGHAGKQKTAPLTPKGTAPVSQDPGSEKLKLEAPGGGALPSQRERHESEDPPLQGPARRCAELVWGAVGG